MASTLKQFSQNEIAPDELGHFKHHFSFTMELENHPLMMAMGAVAIFLILVYLYSHLVTRTSTTNTTSSTSNTPTLTPYTIDVITTGSTGVTTGTGTTGTGTGGTNNPPPVTKPPITNPIPVPITSNLIKVVATGALSTIYGGVHNGGHDILTLQPGNQVSIVSGPVSWGYDTYYQVKYNSTTGWTRAHTIGK